MGSKTKIEWCDSSLNIQMGCDGCELWLPEQEILDCYAGTQIEMRTAGGTIERKGFPASFATPTLFPARMAQALRWPDLTGQERPDKPWLNGYPRLIFLNDMGDTFTESLPENWLDAHIEEMANSPHIYQMLTKRPGRMYRYFERLGYVPKNIWAMTSVTSMANMGRVRELIKLRDITPEVMLGISAEPLLGPVRFKWSQLVDLDWVITGGASGRNARPTPVSWFTDLRDDCESDGGVAFFFKQWGEYKYGARLGKKEAGRLLEGREWNQMPTLR